MYIVAAFTAPYLQLVFAMQGVYDLDHVVLLIGPIGGVDCREDGSQTQGPENQGQARDERYRYTVAICFTMSTIETPADYNDTSSGIEFLMGLFIFCGYLDAFKSNHFRKFRNSPWFPREDQEGPGPLPGHLQSLV